LTAFGSVAGYKRCSCRPEFVHFSFFSDSDCVLVTCLASSVIQSYFEDAQLLCIGVDVNAKLQRCDSNATLWVYDSDNQTLRNEKSSQCLAAQTAQSSQLRTELCNSSSVSQKWTVTSDNERIVHTNTSKCLAVRRYGWPFVFAPDFYLLLDPNPAVSTTDERVNWNHHFGLLSHRIQCSHVEF
jgi:hypothetical protein